jgi:rod shape determining protein RodA
MTPMRLAKHFDKGLLLAVFFLLGISLLVLVGIGARDGAYRLFLRQSIWIFAGLSVFLAVSMFDYRVLRGARGTIFWLYVGGAFLLGAVLVFGSQIRGSTSWFRIGWVGFEPVELVKVIFIIVLAQYFSLRHVESYRIIHITVSLFYAGVYALLILLQPDMGSALVMMGIWLGVVLISGMKLKHFMMLMAGLAVFAMAGWEFYFAPYQKERIVTFLSPGYDLQGTGYNVRQALIAIGAGGIWGKGVAGGSQVQLYFLPESETDFIFAAIGEYFGIAGMIGVIAAIGYILFWHFSVARAARNNFARLAAMGVFFLILVQSGIHIGMNLGLLPVTGVTLPLVSYGGSSVLSTLLAIGIVQGIAIRDRLTYTPETVELG